MQRIHESASTLLQVMSSRTFCCVRQLPVSPETHLSDDTIVLSRMMPGVTHVRTSSNNRRDRCEIPKTIGERERKSPHRISAETNRNKIKATPQFFVHPPSFIPFVNGKYCLCSLGPRRCAQREIYFVCEILSEHKHVSQVCELSLMYLFSRSENHLLSPVVPAMSSSH